MTVSPVPWQKLPPDLAAALGARLEQAIGSMLEAVAGSAPAYADGLVDAKFRRDALGAARVALLRFLELAGTDEPALPPPVREVFVALGAAEARENRGPDVLLGALRVSSRLLLRTITQALADLRPVQPDELLDLSDAVHAFVDELAAASTDGFAQQVREQAGEGDRQRRLLAELLLRGNAAQTAVRAAAAALGWWPLDLVLPVLLPADQARDARFRFAADGLVVERGRDAVLLLRSGPRTVRPVLADSLRGRGAVVGPALAWGRVPEALRLTELAARLLADPGGAAQPEPAGDRPEPVFAEDHLARLAVQGEPGAFAVLEQRRLAALAAIPQPQRDRLLGTLESWLRNWGARSAVSAELYVHPQTVSYRLRRLRDLLGADLDDPVARFELLLVLAGRPPQPGPVRAGG